MTETWSKVTVGSNVFLNEGGVPGILIVEGEGQIVLERGEDDEQLLLTMDLYDAEGSRIGKLRRNAWPPAHDPERFEVTSNPNSLTLNEISTGSVVVEAQVAGQDELNIPRGRFFTKTGHLIEIEPDHWNVGGIRMGSNLFQNCSNGVVIGGDGIGIG